MPKAANTPLSCIFALNKPTGQPSMTLLNKLQPLFSSSSLFKDPSAANDQPKKGGRRGKWKQERVKMGQGGTLDPLADGVLVIGTNGATKQLSQFLDCTKSYRAIALLGCSTDSYDSDGKIVKQDSRAHWDDITKEAVLEKLENFRGEIEQTPPVFSALKMDGKPLYEYARSNTPLPRPIPSRKVTVSAIDLVSFTSGADRTDAYEFPKEKLGEAERVEIERLERMVKTGQTTLPSTEEVVGKDDGGEAKTDAPAAVEPETEVVPGEGSGAASRPPIFEISLTVSSGTYIRSVIHDLGIALGSCAHVVKLTRTRQGQFSLDPAADEAAAKEGKALKGCVEWTLLERAIERQDKVKKGSEEVKAELDKEREAEGSDGYLEWERAILNACETV
ncbi:hypothetical protein JCM11491_004558 [Sporobolomyces phaffii]